MTFVNIAVAISALAGGGGQNGFAPRPDPKNGFAPRPEYGGVLDIFRGFWVSERKRVLKWNFGSFWWLSGNGKTAKNEKNIVHSKILQGFWMPEH